MADSSKKVKISTRINEDVYKVLQDEAVKRHVPLSYIVRIALTQWVSLRDIEVAARASVLGVAKLLSLQTDSSYVDVLQGLLRDAVRDIEQEEQQ